MARVKGMTLEPNWMPTDMGFFGRNYSANLFNKILGIRNMSDRTMKEHGGSLSIGEKEIYEPKLWKRIIGC